MGGEPGKDAIQWALCAHLPEQIGYLVGYLADLAETESYQLDAIP
jgi:hypothetical protein